MTTHTSEIFFEDSELQIPTQDRPNYALVARDWGWNSIERASMRKIVSPHADWSVSGAEFSLTMRIAAGDVLQCQRGLWAWRTPGKFVWSRLYQKPSNTDLETARRLSSMCGHNILIQWGDTVRGDSIGLNRRGCWLAGVERVLQNAAACRLNFTRIVKDRQCAGATRIVRRGDNGFGAVGYPEGVAEFSAVVQLET
jgi:hypothetical protein